MDMSTEKFKSCWHDAVVLERQLRSSEIVEVFTAEETSSSVSVAAGEPKNSSSGGKLIRLGDRNGLIRRRLLMMARG